MSALLCIFVFKILCCELDDSDQLRVAKIADQISLYGEESRQEQKASIAEKCAKENLSRSQLKVFKDSPLRYAVLILQVLRSLYQSANLNISSNDFELRSSLYSELGSIPLPCGGGDTGLSMKQDEAVQAQMSGGGGGEENHGLSVPIASASFSGAKHALSNPSTPNDGDETASQEQEFDAKIHFRRWLEVVMCEEKISEREVKSLFCFFEIARLTISVFGSRPNINVVVKVIVSIMEKRFRKKGLESGSGQSAEYTRRASVVRMILGKEKASRRKQKAKIEDQFLDSDVSESCAVVDAVVEGGGPECALPSWEETLQTFEQCLAGVGPGEGASACETTFAPAVDGAAESALSGGGNFDDDKRFTFAKFDKEEPLPPLQGDRVRAVLEAAAVQLEHERLVLDGLSRSLSVSNSPSTSGSSSRIASS